MAEQLEQARLALLMSRNTASVMMDPCSSSDLAPGDVSSSEDEEMDQELLSARRDLDAMLKRKGFETIPDDDDDDDMSTICMQPGLEEKQVLQLDFAQYGEPLDAFFSLPENCAIERLGKIQSMMENSVIVQALSELPSLDVESVLFWKDRKPFGKIIDLFGLVRSPYYIVRVDQATREQVFKDLELAMSPSAPMDAGKQLHVFFVRDHVKFVCPSQLMDLKDSKGIDEDDTDALYFSDDEQEREYLKNLKKKGTHHNNNNNKGGEASMVASASPSGHQPEFKKPPRKNFRGMEGDQPPSDKRKNFGAPRPPRQPMHHHSNNNNRSPAAEEGRHVYNSYDFSSPAPANVGPVYPQPPIPPQASGYQHGRPVPLAGGVSPYHHHHHHPAAQFHAPPPPAPYGSFYPQQHMPMSMPYMHHAQVPFAPPTHHQPFYAPPPPPPQSTPPRQVFSRVQPTPPSNQEEQQQQQASSLPYYPAQLSFD
eukprot:TRINITY_DN43377_c0_g4_i2.p1 TRINITY_DN43377_c0_g4~~TRINITY_DN43377_c0_g4_i2.p1  ORF type:complete len:523 (-),score=125.97 TRINITY_DN43377_c0_g4_i2:160-1602(-)